MNDCVTYDDLFRILQWVVVIITIMFIAYTGQLKKLTSNSWVKPIIIGVIIIVLSEVIIRAVGA
jgi:uncharacterized membrane protein